MIFLVYLLVGAASGILAGLFGVGGGTIIVPALLLCFTWQGVPTDMQTHLAIGTSLAVISLTSISSTLTHHRLGAVRWPLVFWLAPGIMIGVWCGAYIAAMMAGLQLQRLFGLFAWVIALQMWFEWQPGQASAAVSSNKPNAADNHAPNKGALGVAGLCIGALSALFGIGGGSLTVPFLCWSRVRMQAAVATAAACGFPLALVGAAAYAFQGWHRADLPEHTLGFVYLPAMLGVGISSLPCARIGARLAHRWSARTLKRAFAGFLLLIGGVLLAGIR